MANIAEHYRRRVERLSATLAGSDDAARASEAIRGLVERVTLLPGERRGEIRATLHGDLATIVEWTERRKNKTDTPGSGMSVSVVAGVGFEPTTFRL
jgi:site-specific DNA recombinase